MKPENKELAVIQKNRLVAAAFTLSSQEQRILYTFLSQVHFQGDSVEGKRFKTTTSKIAELWGIKNDHKFRKLLHAAAVRLRSRTIVLKKENDTGRYDTLHFGWVNEVLYEDRGTESEITLTFSPRVAPMISQISGGNFTGGILIKHIKHFKSQHTAHIYMLLMKWKKVGFIEYTLTELRTALEVENKYSGASRFMDQVITRAITEINSHTPWEISYDRVMRARRLYSLKFKIKRAYMTEEIKAEMIQFKQDEMGVNTSYEEAAAALEEEWNEGEEAAALLHEPEPNSIFPLPERSQEQTKEQEKFTESDKNSGEYWKEYKVRKSELF